MATSHANLEDAKKHYTIQTIGNDKVNQLRHARYFKNLDGLKEHMKKHADFMRPKFETTLKVLEEELDGLGIGSWIKPLGGYFISFDAMEGCAKAIVQGGRSYPHRRRSNIPIPQRSKGQQHQNRTFIPYTGGDAAGNRDICSLRKACKCSETA